MTVNFGLGLIDRVGTGPDVLWSVITCDGAW
jgi:hypothetical protein